MTNEIEKKFFEAFGIEPKPNKSGYGLCLKYDNLLKCKSEKKDLMEGCPGCEYFEVCKFYPDITDRSLLKLICLLVAKYWKTKEHYYLTALDEEYLRKEILNDACYVIDGMLSREKEVDFINQVRALFGESEKK